MGGEMIKVMKDPENPDKLIIYFDGNKVGHIMQSDMQAEPEVRYTKLLNRIVNEYFAYLTPRQPTVRAPTRKKTSLAGDIFDVCTFGLFEKW